MTPEWNREPSPRAGARRLQTSEHRTHRSQARLREVVRVREFTGAGSIGARAAGLVSHTEDTGNTGNTEARRNAGRAGVLGRPSPERIRSDPIQAFGTTTRVDETPGSGMTTGSGYFLAAFHSAFRPPPCSPCPPCENGTRTRRPLRLGSATRIPEAPVFPASCGCGPAGGGVVRGEGGAAQPMIVRNRAETRGTLTVAARQTMSASTPKYWWITTSRIPAISHAPREAPETRPSPPLRSPRSRRAPRGSRGRSPRRTPDRGLAIEASRRLHDAVASLDDVAHACRVITRRIALP